MIDVDGVRDNVVQVITQHPLLVIIVIMVIIIIIITVIIIGVVDVDFVVFMIVQY